MQYSTPYAVCYAHPALKIGDHTLARRGQPLTSPGAGWRAIAKPPRDIPDYHVEKTDLAVRLKVDGFTAENALCAEEPYKLGYPAVRLLLLAGIVIGDGFRHCSADRAAIRSADHPRCLRSVAQQGAMWGGINRPASPEIPAISSAKRKPLIEHTPAARSKVLKPNVGYLMQGRRSGSSSALAPTRSLPEASPNGSGGCKAAIQAVPKSRNLKGAVRRASE